MANLQRFVELGASVAGPFFAGLRVQAAASGVRLLSRRISTGFRIVNGYEITASGDADAIQKLDEAITRRIAAGGA